MRHRTRKRPMADINVVPYIDVMLVLLVIFMITAPLLTQGVKVNLPEAKAKTISTKEQEPIILSIDVNGKYYLNVADDPSTPLSSDKITTRVSALLQIAKENNQKRQVMVKGDRFVDYGKVIQAMVLLQSAGADHVGLITKPSSLSS